MGFNEIVLFMEIKDSSFLVKSWSVVIFKFSLSQKVYMYYVFFIKQTNNLYMYLLVTY